LAKENIRVITVYPGLTQSEFSRNVRRLGGLDAPARKPAQPSAPEAPKQPGGLFDRARRGLAVPAEKVADRTLTAIRRNQREVYISWWDRLMVGLITRYPGLFDRAMQQAVPAMGGAEQPAARPVQPKQKASTWMAAGAIGSLFLLGIWVGRQKGSAA
jgi:short-subunit dehydrogenase